jgi:hypothetical protein
LISWQFLKEFTDFQGRENFVQGEEFKTTLFNAPELEYNNHRGTKKNENVQTIKKGDFQHADKEMDHCSNNTRNVFMPLRLWQKYGADRQSY